MRIPSDEVMLIPLHLTGQSVLWNEPASYKRKLILQPLDFLLEFEDTFVRTFALSTTPNTRDSGPDSLLLGPCSPFTNWRPILYRLLNRSTDLSVQDQLVASAIWALQRRRWPAVLFSTFGVPCHMPFEKATRVPKLQIAKTPSVPWLRRHSRYKLFCTRDKVVYTKEIINGNDTSKLDREY
jgi:hypothetical protein